ncbi:outer membrane beta-barrel protein [Thalassolituus sp. LLYu03]|uniref:outer membrane beta-barrel protein n=1 Tax=Thalassolituus sp. LLYu03 TaxID=3421656 RepID=UPI003D281857
MHSLKKIDGRVLLLLGALSAQPVFAVPAASHPLQPETRLYLMPLGSTNTYNSDDQPGTGGKENASFAVYADYRLWRNLGMRGGYSRWLNRSDRYCSPMDAQQCVDWDKTLSSWFLGPQIEWRSMHERAGINLFWGYNWSQYDTNLGDQSGQDTLVMLSLNVRLTQDVGLDYSYVSGFARELDDSAMRYRASLLGVSYSF